MTTKVLALGFDAAEATLIERWAEQGLLPNFSRLIGESRRFALSNCMETLPGAIWPELISGRSAGQLGVFFHPAQLHSGETGLRPVEERELKPEEYYWWLASQAGKRVAVIDLPQAALVAGLNGIQLLEWGLHDRPFRMRSEPPELLDEVLARYGRHLPHDGRQRCDNHGRSRAGYRRLLDQLLDGAEKKTRLLVDLLNREEWDLFTAGFGESHCVGHQFWGFYEAGLTGNVDPEFGDALLRVYQALDRGLGRLRQAAGPQSRQLIYTSHGMGHYVAGYQLIREVLVRLGLGSARRDSRWQRTLRLLQDRGNRYAPDKLRPLLSRLVKAAPVKAIQAQAGSLVNPLESSQTRAVVVRNNRCGAVRLNLLGREPFGCVQPGEEAGQLVDTIKTALLELRHPVSDQAIVKQVWVTEELYGPRAHPDLPDLMVDFRTDLGTLESCYSERVGLISVPYFHALLPRSGDHTPISRLWWAGPGINASANLEHASVLDIAPTILQLLGVPVPAFVEGQPIPVL